jgi:hypothetical protein
VAERERVREKVKTGLMSMEASSRDMPLPLVTQDGREGPGRREKSSGPWHGGLTGEWQVPVGDPLHEPAQLSDRFATTPDRLLRDDLGG